MTSEREQDLREAAKAMQADDQTAATPMQISAAFQMEPLWNPDRVGERAFTGDLDQFAQDMAAYLATQLERFADIRGGDLYLALTVKRGGEHASHEYRSGHYVKDRAGD